MSGRNGALDLEALDAALARTRMHTLTPTPTPTPTHIRSRVPSRGEEGTTAGFSNRDDLHASRANRGKKAEYNWPPVTAGELQDLIEAYATITRRKVWPTMHPQLIVCLRVHGPDTSSLMGELHSRWGTQNLLARLRYAAPRLSPPTGPLDASSDRSARYRSPGDPLTAGFEVPIKLEDKDAGRHWTAEELGDLEGDRGVA